MNVRTIRYKCADIITFRYTGDANFPLCPEMSKTPDEQRIAPNGERRLKNPAAVALGRLGGKKGGAARAKSLSPKRRKEIALLAARARWKGNRSK